MTYRQHSPQIDTPETYPLAGGSTIVALSTGALPSGVAVIRASGPGAAAAIQRLAGSVPKARQTSYRTLRLSDGTVLDRGLVLFFPAPRSFTGEDCAEFHVHGGRAVVAALLKALCGQPGLRLAEPGEFTRRAFANGKMSLLDSESLSDLISAETESERRFAIENGAGRHADLYAGWRRAIIRARAAIEAQLDFGDEDDVPDTLPEKIWSDLVELERLIRDHAAGYRRAELVRDGFDVVLLGSPNSGKSSLLNAFAEREVAIVTDEAGTTRDPVEVVLDLGGAKVRVTDTAGIRETAGKVEQIGIARALERAASADLVLLLAPGDGSAPQIEAPQGVPVLHIATMADRGTPAAIGDADMSVSAMTGDRVGELLTMIAQRARQALPASSEILPWKARHVALLIDAADGLREARASADLGLEMRAEALRSASRSLGRIAGDVDVEDLLDAIFANFCIGK